MCYTKICTVCRVEKSIEEFHFNNKKSGKRRSRCKVCQAKYIQKYKSENEEKVRDIWRKSSRKYITRDRRRNKTLAKYGLRNEDYNRMYDAQEGKCKICGSQITLVVDHCHRTNIIRGLLCNMCNVGIGCFYDNIIIIERAVEYLRNCGELR